MTRVVVAIDDHPAADEIIGVGRRVAELFDAAIDLVHVHCPHDAQSDAAAGDAGLELCMLDGPVAATLRDRVFGADVAAAVIGATERRLGTSTVGHIATELVVSLEKPVVVVPHRVQAPAAIRRLLVPLDGTAQTRQILAQAGVDLALGVEVVLVHVRDTVPMFTDQPHHELRAWSAEFIERYCPPFLRGAGLQVRSGVPADEIIGALEQSEADLVVLGWSRRLSAGRGRIVRRLLEHGGLPILLVPALERLGLAGARPDPG